MRVRKVAFFCAMYRAMESARTVEERVLQRRRFWKRSEDFWIYTSLDEDKGSTVEMGLLVWRKPRSLASDLCFGLCLVDVSFSDILVCMAVCLSANQVLDGEVSRQETFLSRRSHNMGICVRNEIFYWYLVAQLKSQEDRQQNAIQKNLAKGIYHSPPRTPSCLLLLDSYFSPLTFLIWFQFIRFSC